MDPEDLPDLRAMADARGYQELHYNRREHRLYTERPFVVLALVLDRTLGDFISRNLFAATVTQRFEDSRLIVYYRPDRPYKDAIIRLNPKVSTTWRPVGDNSIPFDYFDTMGQLPIKAPTDDWYRSFAAEPDLVLTPSMMDLQKLHGLGPLARFTFPDGEAERRHAQLLAAGLDEDRWFCVMHYRETGYREGDANAHRDFDPLVVPEIIDHIVRSFGGQVVRVGHSGMSRIPPREGFVDLSSVEDPFMLHAYAVSRARFFLELSPSGPMALAGAFGVPTARCNALSQLGVVDDASFALMQHIVGKDGMRVGKDVALRKGLFRQDAVDRIIGRYGYRFVRNSLEELKAAADEIHRRTTDCPGWRDPADGAPARYPESFTLPLPEPPDIDVVEFPDAFPDFTAG